MILGFRLSRPTRLYHSYLNNKLLDMISDRQLKSMIKIQGGDKEEEEQESLLDISHQDLKKLTNIDLNQYEVDMVDASYNYFKDFDSLNFKESKKKQGITIKWIDLSFNFIEQIDQIAEKTNFLKYLTYLNLTANRIESVDFTNHQLPVLQTLILNSNKIKYFMHCPENIKVLTLDSNQLSTVAFSGGLNLTVLSAHNNFIKKIALKLSELLLIDMESNLVQDLTMVKDLLSCSKKMLSINFRENPVAKERLYKIAILQQCDWIGQIDQITINPQIRQGFKIIKAQQQLDDMIEQVNKKYAVRLAQKQRIKQQLIKKIRGQEKDIQAKFQKGISEEKEQFQLLQKQAKEMLGRKRLDIIGENNRLKSNIKDYYQSDVSNPHEETQKQEEGVVIQRQYLNDYLAYLQKIRQKPIQKPVIKEAETKKQHKTSLKKRNSSFKQKISPPQPKQVKDKLKLEFKGLKLFDPKCISYLLKGYIVNVVEM